MDEASHQLTWLVLRAQAGDRDALDALLQSVQRPLHRYLAAMLGDSADDVLQEVLFQIYRKLTWLREPAVFQSWAFRIASRAAFRRLERTRRLKEEPLQHEVVAEIETNDSEALIASLPAHIEALSPASRAVVTLHYLEGMPLQEVADILAIPLGTAKSRLAYGLRCLREEIRK